MRFTALIALTGLVACSGEDLEDTGPPPVPADPHVSSWSPDFAPLPSVQRVIYLGDSVTAGYGIAATKNTYTNLLVENSDAWPEFQDDDLTARYGDLEIVDVSRSGARTADLLDTQIPNMEAELGDVVSGPTLIIMTIGGNDITGALASPGDLPTVADDIEANIEAVADVFTDPNRFPDGSLMLLANVYEPTDGEGQADECFLGLDVTAAEPVLDDVNDRTLALAMDMGFAWVDMRSHFTGHGWNRDNAGMPTYDEADPTLWFQSDCIHANKRGHHEIRRLFLAAADNTQLDLWVPDE